jgi:hypothetical protein
MQRASTARNGLARRETVAGAGALGGMVHDALWGSMPPRFFLFSMGSNIDSRFDNDRVFWPMTFHHGGGPPHFYRS